jgi:Flp pilus assembly protein protease CpaA
MADPVAYTIMFLSLGLLVVAGLHDTAARTIPNWMIRAAARMKASQTSSI